MTNFILPLLFTFSLVASLAAQDDKPRKGLRADLFYGGPNLISRIIEAVDINKATTSLTNFGPIGVRAEYFFSETFSVGAEIHQAASGYTREITRNDGFQTYVFRDELRINRTRVYPRVAVHFGKENFDAFWYGGVGFANWSTRYEVLENTNGYFSGINPITINRSSGVAFRTGIGLRYFFSDKIGLNADFGIGGPLVTAGLSGRF